MLEREALQLAVQDAMERATAIAIGAGKAVGPIVRLHEQRQSSAGIRLMFEATGGGGGRGGAQTPITPGEIEVRAVVTLTVAPK